MLQDGSIVPLKGMYREKISMAINLLASKGLRVLACAYKTGLGNLDDYAGPLHPQQNLLLNAESYATMESDLTFVGLVGMQV
jgi:magnesium-transporting ATPase (P-type)